MGPIRMVHSRLQSALEIEGTAQPGFQSFGLPMPASTPAIWCRKWTSAQTVSVYDISGGFVAITRPGFETVVFSISSDHLDEVGECLGIGASKEISSGTEVHTCCPRQMSELRHLLAEITGALAGASVRTLRRAFGELLSQTLART